MNNDFQDPDQTLFQLSEQWSGLSKDSPPQEELSPWNTNTAPLQTWSKSFGQYSSVLTRDRRQRWRNTVVILASIVSIVMLATGALLVFALPGSTPSQTALKAPLASSTPSTPGISTQATRIVPIQVTSAPTSTPTPVPTSTPLPASVNQPTPVMTPTQTLPTSGTAQPTVTGNFIVSLNTQTSNANVALNITIQNFTNKQFFVNITDQANGAQVLHQIENTDAVGHNDATILIHAPPGVQNLPKSWVTSITDTQGKILSTAAVIVKRTTGKATF